MDDTSDVVPENRPGITPSTARGKAWIASRADDFRVFDEALTKLSQHTDRELALVASSVLEEHLKTLLKSYLIKLPSEGDKGLFDRGPLQSFASRISIAYAMGIISSIQKDDLNCVKNARNAFAHNIQIDSFGHERPSGHCANMRIVSEDDFLSLNPFAGSVDFAIDNAGEYGLSTGEAVGIAIADSQGHVLYWTSPYEGDVSNPRARFINCVRSAYVCIGLQLALRYKLII